MTGVIVRQRELELLDDTIGRGARQGAALVACGDPGIGMSALLEAARATAGACPVGRARA